MKMTANFLTRVCLFACMCLAVSSCKDTDDYFSKRGGTGDAEEARYFDFSTTQDVDLFVDYSAFDAKVPVFFRIYKDNPFVNENAVNEYIDENIKPLFSGYTNKEGRFDERVTLPAYAKVVHVVTGNFLVGLRRNIAEVVNGELRVVVNNPMANGTRSFSKRVVGTGTSTNDLSKMPHLYKKSDGTEVYKPWVTPLGTWNSASGRPDYLLDKNDQAMINKGLVFTEEEFNGMYATACAALNSGTSMKESYRAASDLKLIKDSEVSITAMGSSTCWNSSLGYYYYTGNAPTNKKDLNVIMLFPNTQDGEWPRGSYPNNKYKGNIGTLRGDVVQLMYYPVKDGSLDLENGTTVFPAGTKIGFMLKTNAWGQRGSDYAVNECTGKKNIWVSTSEGLSSAFDGGKFPNPNGEARSAKFAYTAPNGQQYVVVSFEDACDDKDYDDLMFALNPADAFDLKDTPKIESQLAALSGIYAFEDMWPTQGDYDMNDVVIGSDHQVDYYLHPDGNVMLSTETYYLTTYQNIVGLKSGLAVEMDINNNNKDNIATIYVDKIRPGQEKSTSSASDFKMYEKKYYYHKDFSWDKNDPYIWYLTDDVKGTLGTTYVFTITYVSAVNKSQTSVKPFLYRKEGNKQWEVHLPWVNPTSKMNEKYFGTYNDKSDPTVQRPDGRTQYYVGSSDYPFAFYLDGVSIEKFKNTILKFENESKPINELYPEFLDWSRSNGQVNEEWYLHPVTE